MEKRKQISFASCLPLTFLRDSEQSWDRENQAQGFKKTGETVYPS